MPRALAHGSAGLLNHFFQDAVVSSSMWMIADCVAQNVEIRAGLFPARQQTLDTAQGVDLADAAEGQRYDWWRTGRFGLVGIPSGIWLHAWFRLLDFWFPHKTVGTVVLMSLIDWVGESPYILSNMSMNAYLENFSFEQVKKTIRNDFVACNLWNLVFWFPADIVMFLYVPVGWQLLVVRAADLVFLPVDSYFSNRSIAKPGLDHLNAENEAQEEDPHPEVGGKPDPDEIPSPTRPRESASCSCAVM
eukprot:TRINITY_DN5611_c0_g2_i1.p1 TRINITY_DN5611_c0_g2~~TRINITY_DN5611_c0_g2_i1.p1  ORF type:complete len:247 (+),score=20.25 TRINITY_DN5611_c0_g2_i1:165-905(+)